jgi:hypothetical protein
MGVLIEIMLTAYALNQAIPPSATQDFVAVFHKRRENYKLAWFSQRALELSRNLVACVLVSRDGECRTRSYRAGARILRSLSKGR